MGSQIYLTTFMIFPSLLSGYLRTCWHLLVLISVMFVPLSSGHHVIAEVSKVVEIHGHTGVDISWPRIEGHYPCFELVLFAPTREFLLDRSNETDEDLSSLGNVFLAVPCTSYLVVASIFSHINLHKSKGLMRVSPVIGI